MRDFLNQRQGKQELLFTENKRYMNTDRNQLLCLKEAMDQCKQTPLEKDFLPNIHHHQ